MEELKENKEVLTSTVTLSLEEFEKYLEKYIINRDLEKLISICIDEAKIDKWGDFNINFDKVIDYIYLVYHKEIEFRKCELRVEVKDE